MIHTYEKDKNMREKLIEALISDLIPILNISTIYNKDRLYEAYKPLHTYSKYRFIIFLKVFLKHHGYIMVKETNHTFQLFNQNDFKI